MTPGLAVYLAAFLAIASGNALKEKWWMIIFSAGIIGIITLIRVAKPGSYWDRHWSSVTAHEKAVDASPSTVTSRPRCRRCPDFSTPVVP